MKKTYPLVLITLFMACHISAQTVTLDNGIARMDLKLNGGTITEFSLNAVDVNPMHEYGHFLCFDRWGPSSPEDQALGIPFHGEASKVTWTLQQGPIMKQGYYFTEMSCYLPIVKLGMDRKIYLNNNSSVFKVVEEISNHNDAPRVFNVVQHATLGAPFLDETTIVDTKVVSGFSQAGTLPPSPGELFTWPDAVVDGDPTDLRYIASDHTWNAAVVSFTLDENEEYGWVTAINPSLNLMVGYLWQTAEYPWLNLWFNFRNDKPYARGLEFGSTGLHQPWPTVLEMDSILGKKLYDELDVDEKITKSYYAFLSEIPSDYKGVESVTIVGDQIKVEEYGADSLRTIYLDIAGIKDAKDSTVTGNHLSVSIPEFELTNFPNPFSSKTTISYTLQKDSHVKLIVNDISGQMVAKLVDAQRQAGPHSEQFTPLQAEAGTYLCKLTTESSTSIRKMVLVK